MAWRTISWVAGMTMHRTPPATFLPLRTAAAALRSLMRPLVQEPMTTWLMGRPATSDTTLVFSGRWGMATVGSSLSRSMTTSRAYTASGSASKASQGRFTRPLMYSMVFSSTGKMPFLPPASMAMLEMVNRSSMDREATPSPVNSRDWYRAPSTPISPIRWRITSLPDTMGWSLPFSVTLMAAGTLNHRRPVAMAAAMSVEPMPVEKAPTAP